MAGGGGKTLTLPCASTALKVVAQTLPLSCVSFAFVAQTLPFLVALRRAGVLLSGRVEGEGGDHDGDEGEVEEEERVRAR